MAAEIVLALQAMVTRRVDVFDPAVVTIAHIAAGTTTNIIPETAFVEGTIRTTSEEARALVHAGVRRVVEGICAAHDATAELEIVPATRSRSTTRRSRRSRPAWRPRCWAPTP